MRLRKPASISKRRGYFHGGLILRILSVNVIAPLVLVLGVLYIGQYRDALISAELETLKAHAQLFAGAVAESAIRPVQEGQPFLFAKPEDMEALMPDLSKRVVRRLAEATGSRARLFNDSGKLLVDSEAPTVAPVPVPVKGPLKIVAAHDDEEGMENVLRYVVRDLLAFVRTKSTLQPYPAMMSVKIKDHPDAQAAIRGRISATAWEDAKGNIILSAAAPVKKARQVMGVVLLTRDGAHIEAAMIQVRFDVLMVFLVALTITILLSIYLAWVIGQPLKRLAVAAEAIHQGKSRNITIPDLSRRKDEIGELSVALRDMTQALWDRMDTIENFAADVAHEIKNPLTSLRSAVETVGRVKSVQDRDRLMEIIHHDVQRLDRLISDISNASRLDAELSRDEMGAVDLRRLLEQLADLHRAPLERGQDGMERPVILDLPAKRDITVRGNEGRLAQVFENLIANALSFAPDRPVTVRVNSERKRIVVTIEDSGPGIPENKLETIFERFYSERPKHEDYGSHSGLGLSIARQIVVAHGGEIFAKNLYDVHQSVIGAQFTVVLDATS